MKLEFFIILGVFCNLMLASIFPFQLLDTTTATALVGDQEINYDFSGSGFFDDNLKNTNSEFDSNMRNTEDTGDMLSTSNSTFTNVLTGGDFGFFDGIVDSLTKLKTLVSMIIPFASMFFLLPGALGLIIGSLYTAGLIFAIIRFIRGA